MFFCHQSEEVVETPFGTKTDYYVNGEPTFSEYHQTVATHEKRSTIIGPLTGFVCVTAFAVLAFLAHRVS